MANPFQVHFEMGSIGDVWFSKSEPEWRINSISNVAVPFSATVSSFETNKDEETTAFPSVDIRINKIALTEQSHIKHYVAKALDKEELSRIFLIFSNPSP